MTAELIGGIRHGIGSVFFKKGMCLIAREPFRGDFLNRLGRWTR